MYMGCLYIYIEHRISKHENTCGFLVQVRNFLLPLSLKVIRHKERDTHSFYFGFFICPPSRATPAQGLREQAKVNRLLQREVSTKLTDFSKSQNSPRASGAWRHLPSLAPFPIWAIVTYLCVNTCVNVAPK